MSSLQVKEIQKALEEASDPKKQDQVKRFFKTGPGQYAENDLFIGVSVPAARNIAKQFQSLPLFAIKELLKSPIHEERLTALILLTMQMQKTKNKKEIVRCYLEHTKWVNNWDLVDISAHHILGPDNEKEKILTNLSQSSNLWERRIAIVATWHDIRKKDFDLPFQIIKILLYDKEDLIQKAVGWMLREIGKKDKEILSSFLNEHAPNMPRVSLRYAIEHFTPEKRKFYLSLKI